MLDHEPFFKSHSVFNGFILIVNFVKIVHELVSFSLLVLLFTLFGRDAFIEPILLLFEVFDLDLLLEVKDLNLFVKSIDVNFTLGEGTVFVGVSEFLVAIEDIKHLNVTKLNLVLLCLVSQKLEFFSSFIRINLIIIVCFLLKCLIVV